MSKTTRPTGLACPLCRSAVARVDGVETCERCGWSPPQGAD